MEAKLYAYRNKKRREAMVEAAKNTIKEALSWQRSSPATAAAALDVRLQDKDDLESIISEESIDLTPPPSPFCSRTMCFLYFMLWATLYIIAVQVQFGAVYFVISVLVFIYFNTRSGPKKKGEVSAYSVFNPDCQSIDGTLKAEQFEREIRYGAASVH
ncbi:SAYSvFN domain-containing protein 1 isoform X1 [Nasonia vitripennis]|uniref:SAYSvFN domain-containing protein n=1 Tax=Nasonia vitripennis TaxID=7425 RepID=A0A7M7IVL1_NASVI|nr:SAYSvFN domain-containing protein 1 isoform X1 [Nasonia vitripennis]